MRNDRVATLQSALDYVEKLPPDEQETLIEIIKKRMIERRRDEIARHAKDTINAIKEKRAKYGTIEDLKRDLSSD
ncbi:MAG: hypothetical protein GWP10_21785 [Nitrospiraceae bacterium]|nr:hypothetical protein [Nitrospiraceae bacterium]